MIDFSALVLGPAMSTFAQTISLTPLASQPGALAYPSRGVFDFKPVEIQLEDGTVHSTNEPTLGIRLSEFGVAPMQGDAIVMAQGAFLIADVVPDGQGGARLTLRRTDSPEAAR